MNDDRPASVCVGNRLLSVGMGKGGRGTVLRLPDAGSSAHVFDHFTSGTTTDFAGSVAVKPLGMIFAAVDSAGWIAWGCWKVLWGAHPNGYRHHRLDGALRVARILTDAVFQADRHAPQCVTIEGASTADLAERTMPYNLPPDVQDQIRQHIATGQYSSEDDVLRAALRALAFRRDELAAVQAGLDDMEAGRVSPFEDVDADIRRQFGFPNEP